jgi:aspartate kinase
MSPARQPLEVHKFGGASLADPAAIRRAIAILAQRPGRRVVVVSAMAGVTDLLLTAASKARSGDVASALQTAAALRDRHGRGTRPGPRGIGAQ